MTRLLTSCFFLYTTLFLFSIAACDKDKTTTINGTVVDKVTGMPIEDAIVAIRITHSKNQPPNDIEYEDILTDPNGSFSFSSNDPISIYDIQKGGYLPKGLESDIPTIKQGEINEVILKMIPLDGNLKLQFNNTSAILDTLYIGIYSPLVEAEYSISYGVAIRESFYVTGLSSQVKTFNLSSEEVVDIYWGNSPLPYKIRFSPFLHDSVYISRGDTTNFTISF